MDRDQLDHIAHTLWADIYETEFGGKDRGAFRITRRQLRDALGGERPDAVTFMRLNALACEAGLMLIDLGNSYACIEIRALRALRRVPDRTLGEALAADCESPDEDDDQSSQRRRGPRVVDALAYIDEDDEN